MPDSWWLKVKRAQKHMVDIHTEIRRYARSKPYRFEPMAQPESKGHLKWRLRITEQPDPMLPLMIGDFIHNLRSALDHVVVASVPDGSTASFPFDFKGLFATDANGEFVIKDDDARKSFNRSIDGIAPEARTIIINAQPYHSAKRANLQTLGVISRIDNADKHRKLTAFGAGLTGLAAEKTFRGAREVFTRNSLSEIAFLKNNALIGIQDPERGYRPVRASELQPEMEMNLSGTAVIFIQLVPIGGRTKVPTSFKLNWVMVNALRETRRIVRALEPFAIYKPSG